MSLEKAIEDLTKAVEQNTATLVLLLNNTAPQAADSKPVEEPKEEPKAQKEKVTEAAPQPVKDEAEDKSLENKPEDFFDDVVVPKTKEVFKLYGRDFVLGIIRSFNADASTASELDKEHLQDYVTKLQKALDEKATELV